jgi:opacity protein-like surface antigen
MAFRPILALAVLCGLAAPAMADDAVTPKLPTLALDPQPLSASPWSGFYAGSEVFAISRKGVKGAVGGAAFVGYNRELDNNMVIGIEASTGYSPSAYRHGPISGYDFAQTNFKLGYDMGRLMPFLTAGVAFAKPNFRGPGYTGAGDSINDLFGSPSDVRVFGTVGAGFDYAITDHLSVGLAISAGTGTGRGLVAP